MPRLELIPASLSDIARIQKILDAAPTYSLNVEGTPSSPSGAIETLETIPSGVAFDRKHVFLIQANDEDIGLADVIEGYPSPEIAFIGLLLLRESHQKKGLGIQAYSLLEKFIESKGISRIQLSVVDS